MGRDGWFLHLSPSLLWSRTAHKVPEGRGWTRPIVSRYVFTSIPSSMGQPPPPLLWGHENTRREPARAILRVIGTLVAAALYLISAVIALRSLQPFSPPNADAIFLVGVTAVAVLAFAASRAATISVRRASFVVVTLLGTLAPFAMVQWMPGVAQPREFPIPGGPDHVTSASPSGDADLYLMPDGQPDRTFALTRRPARRSDPRISLPMASVLSTPSAALTVRTTST